MKAIAFGENTQYDIALLIKSTAFNEAELDLNFVSPLEKAGIPRNNVIASTLSYNTSGKAPVKHIRTYLDDLMPLLKEQGIKYLYVADSAYFKVLAGTKKAEPNLGFALPCQYKGYENMTVVYGINHKSLVYNPANEAKLHSSVNALIAVVKGQYVEPGSHIIQHEEYPQTLDEIKTALNKLMDKPYLAVDIEAFSLRHDEAGIGTICFCWGKHEGLAFAVDYVPYSAPLEDGSHGYYRPNPEVHECLRTFFENYKGRMRMHNAPYDSKVIVFEAWMKKDHNDNESMLLGIDTLYKNLDDTKIITYLATNSCAGNHLSLKDQAQEFAGNWGLADINDISKVPLPELLKYNLVDGLCTNYVFDKHYQTMVNDQQEDLYRGMMMDSQDKITQLELTGMPMNPEKIQQTKKTLETIQKEQLKLMYSMPVIHRLEAELRVAAMNAANAKLKKKQHPLSKFDSVKFNPNSGPQLQKLLYNHLHLPIIDRTDAKQPATGAKTIEKLKNHCKDPDVIALMDALVTFGKAGKVLSSFIPAFERAISHDDGSPLVWLHGSFNLGGTKSGRLSSSDPNLQNIPSGSTYAKLVKECFEAPRGWIMVGADFNSLEDYISALTTKDPNKLKVYLEGYDGHSLRAFTYWPDKFPFDEITPENSFLHKTDKLWDAVRSDSKGPTFSLTYQGTIYTLMNDQGFSEEEAIRIDKNYHELYKVSDQYVDARLDQACKDGYVDVAFGLRLRTPLLAKTIRGNGFTSFAADAEGRTAGNALGQSYGLLNNRAFNEFMDKVRASEFRNDIRPIALIHDAIYLVIRDSIRVVDWVNQELIKSMQWQELPEIQHDEVKIGAELDLFWPSWANAITLKNDDTKAEIRKKSQAAVSDFHNH